MTDADDCMGFHGADILDKKCQDMSWYIVRLYDDLALVFSSPLLVSGLCPPSVR